MSRDILFKAKSPGKRVSKSGEIYYEYRKNRTDVKGRDAPKILKSQETKIRRLRNFINSVVKEKTQKDKILRLFIPLPKTYKFVNAKGKILKLIEANKIKINRNSDELEIKRQVAWEEKQAHKLDRLKKGIKKYKFIAQSTRDEVRKIQSFIPFGQPILVGHHSQKRHERDLDRMWNKTQKSFDAATKARELETRLKNIPSNTAILSDDPQALKKLRLKLKALEDSRDKMKAYNKKARKDKSLKSYETWQLTNLGANIRTTAGRIKEIEAKDKMADVSKSKKGLKLVTDKISQRVQLLFDDKPDTDMRTLLKRNGYRWSPRYGAWQKKLLPNNVYRAKRFFEAYPSKLDTYGY